MCKWPSEIPPIFVISGRIISSDCIIKEKFYNNVSGSMPAVSNLTILVDQQKRWRLQQWEGRNRRWFHVCTPFSQMQWCTLAHHFHGPVPNVLWSGAGPQTGGWGLLLYATWHHLVFSEGHELCIISDYCWWKLPQKVRNYTMLSMTKWPFPR